MRILRCSWRSVVPLRGGVLLLLLLLMLLLLLLLLLHAWKRIVLKCVVPGTCRVHAHDRASLQCTLCG
jgi:hypothetical protein